MLSAICCFGFFFYTQRLLASKRLQTGPSTFPPSFFKQPLFTSPRGVCPPWAQLEGLTRPLFHQNPTADCLWGDAHPSVLPPLILFAQEPLLFSAPTASHSSLCARVTSTTPPAVFLFVRVLNPYPTLPLVGSVLNLLFYSI